MRTISKLFALAFFALLISCGGNKATDESNAGAEFDAAKDNLKEDIVELIVDMPSPSEIPWLLEQTGSDYNSSLINSHANADKYLASTEKAALNLGIYAADIGYLASYEQVQDALEYMQSTKMLADQLGIVGSLDISVVERFENNLGSRDSLKIIIDQAILDTDMYLKDDNRNSIAALVVGGSFIEGLYISTELIRTYPKDLLPEDARTLILMPLTRVVLDQEKPLNELIRLVESLNDDALDALEAQLKELQALYTELNIEEKISQNNADLILNDETLSGITQKVNSIRANITS